jgi:hypothetical protein
MRAFFSLVALATLLSGCGAMGDFFPDFNPSTGGQSSGVMTPMVPPGRNFDGPIRSETLTDCRGHVLVPAMGMTFVPSGGRPPGRGQYLREESLTAPYRVLPPGAAATMDFVPSRLNIDLDSDNRIINIRCG